MKGIDISEHNGIIDFSKVKDEVDFVMIRATFGKKEDKMLKKNARGCIENKIPFGFYYYSYALDEKYAKEEVSYFLQAIKEYKEFITFPLAIDMEDSDKFKEKNGFPTNEVLCNICKVACDSIGNAGYYPVIYANLDYFTHKLNLESIEKYNKWLAWWSKDSIEKVDKSKYQMLQYSKLGKVSGIGTNVDMNESFVEFNKLILYINNLKMIQEIKLRTGLEDLSIQFLSCYKYGQDLLKKIHKRVTNYAKVKNPSDDIHKIIQDEFELENKTITYMECYLYSEDLFLKLYKAICEEKE